MTTACQPEPPGTDTRRSVATNLLLTSGKLIVLQDSAGSRVNCMYGQLWITQENDGRDIILEAGQSYTLDRQGKAIIQGMPCARVDIR